MTLFIFLFSTVIRILPTFFGKHDGAGPRGRGKLDEAGGNVRIQDDVRLLREDRVQSVRARLDRLCSRRDLDLVQRAITVSLCGREKIFAYLVSVALRASAALGSQPGTSSAKSIRRMWEGTVFIWHH